MYDAEQAGQISMQVRKGRLPKDKRRFLESVDAAIDESAQSGDFVATFIVEAQLYLDFHETYYDIEKQLQSLGFVVNFKCEDCHLDQYRITIEWRPRRRKWMRYFF